MTTSNAYLLRLAVAALFLAGCAAPTGVRLRQNGAPPVALSPDSALLPHPGISFAISPADRLRVQILPLPAPAGGWRFAPQDRLQFDLTLSGPEYRVLRGDELTVSFPSDPKLETTVTVRPDGRITLGNGEEILVQGRTPREISAAIDQSYQSRMPHPDASVAVAKTNFALAELAGQATVQADGSIALPRLGHLPAAGLTPAQVADRLSTAASTYYGNTLTARVSRLAPAPGAGGLAGFDQIVTVAPNGLIVLPDIGVIDTTGKTVAAVQGEIQAAVGSLYPNPTAVVLGITASETRVVYVDGEVARPGPYALTPGLTLLKAITTAGGSNDTADLRRVLLIHRTAHDDVWVYASNLRTFIEKGDKENDLPVAPQDIVVVVKTSVAKVDLWIDQYITRMLPFSRDVNYSYSQGVTRLNNPTTP
jgi:protein involved in polysaccharide export with SLBB domain